MLFVVCVSLISCAGMVAATLILPKIRIKNVSLSTYWLITLFGALLLIVCGSIGFGEVFAGLTADGAMNPLKILILFLSMTLLSVFLDETGFFKYLANWVLKKSGKSQFKVFTAFYFATSVLTVFTSNDIIILTFTPFICYFAKRANINPVPYLFSEFVAANTASMLLIIGNPTNIYLGTSSGITFVEYFEIMILPTALATFTAYGVMLLLFGKKLKPPLDCLDEEVTINKKPLLVAGIMFLSVSTILLAVSFYINIEMWLIALCGATGLAVTVLIWCLHKREKPVELVNTIRRLPWELVPFVLSMFVFVLALDKYQVTEGIASFLGESGVVATYGAASVVFANFMNNIPMSVLFASVLQNLSPALQMQAAYAVIIGSNIGAYLTPVGALAGIMWLRILKDNGIDFSFGKFVKYGAAVAVPVLAAALLGLFIVTL